MYENILRKLVQIEDVYTDENIPRKLVQIEDVYTVIKI